MACVLLKSNHLTTRARREPHNRLRLRREILIRRRPLYDQPLMPHAQCRRQASVACIRRWRADPRARSISIAVEMEALARMHIETRARLAAYRDEIRAGCHLSRAKDAFRCEEHQSHSSAVRADLTASTTKELYLIAQRPIAATSQLDDGRAAELMS